MKRLLGLAWEIMRRRCVGARVSETSVQRILLEQAGVAVVESVRLVPGATCRRQLQVRIRIAEGCDVREVTDHAAEVLLRNLSVTEICLLGSAGDEPAFRASGDDG